MAGWAGPDTGSNKSVKIVETADSSPGKHFPLALPETGIH